MHIGETLILSYYEFTLKTVFGRSYYSQYLVLNLNFHVEYSGRAYLMGRTKRDLNKEPCPSSLGKVGLKYPRHQRLKI